MSIGQEIKAHYGRGGLEAAVLDALAAEGKDPLTLTPADLQGADQLHFGWHPATMAVGEALGLKPGMRVLDVGCGVGGPARALADRFGCVVTGVDLSEEMIGLAETLTRRCGLDDRISYWTADATTLPLGDEMFDAAVMLHVGMNLPDKAGVFAEVRRALAPGGLFAVYDAMQIGEAEPRFPLPWAEDPRTSFVERPEDYRRLLSDSGFEIVRETDRRAWVLELARERREKAGRDGKPPSALHALLGPATAERLANAMAALQESVLAPVEILARRA